MREGKENLGEGGANVTFLESSQVLPACPSDISRINLKNLKLYEVINCKKWTSEFLFSI
jgi:hypothetical protein